MAELTQRETTAAHRLSDAILEFLIALEEGKESRNLPVQTTKVEAKPAETPVAITAIPKSPEESKARLTDLAQLIGPGEVAELLGCSTRHVYRLVDMGKLPRPRKLGALVRWPLVEIRKWVEDGCPTQLRKR